MKHLVSAIGCCVVAACVLILWTAAWPDQARLELTSEAERARLLDRKIERSRRFGAVIREVDEAVGREGLPLREAAACLVAAAERIDPDQLRLVDTVERLGRGPLEKTARLLVKRFRVEILGYGNPFGLPEGLMDRLERELAEMTDGDASPDARLECRVH